MPGPLRAKLRGVCRSRGVEEQELLAPLAREYQEAGYNAADFADVLVALNGLLERRPEIGLRAHVLPDDAVLGGGPREDALILYLDPNCSLCRALFEKVVDLNATCMLGERMPLVIRPLVPPHDGHAFAAGLAMRLLRRRDPAEYVAAVSTMFSMASNGQLPSDARELLRRLEPAAVEPAAEELESAERYLREDFSYFSAKELHGPLLYYRGKRISKSRGAVFAFEPAFDGRTLHFTLDLVRAVSARRGKT